MHTITCDKCHKEVENYLKFGYSTSEQLGNTVKLKIGNEEIDLCANCQKEIRRWVSEPPPRSSLD